MVITLKSLAKGVCMKERYTHLDKKLYFTAMVVLVILMNIGLLYDNTIELKLGFILHAVLVTLESICLLIYPIYKNHMMRVFIIILGSAYFYTIFFIYPETVTSFVLLCFVPVFSILFFNTKLFHFSIILNILSMMGTFFYIAFIDQSNQYSYIKLDTMGNMVNFLLSQLIIYAIYYLFYDRVKKQQLYYEQLQNSERLKTTGQLAAAVAHEIRNPLTTVKGFLQLYSENGAPFSNEVKQNFTLMINELEMAEKVITQFLTLAKPDKDKNMEIVNVNVGLQSVTDLLKSYGFLHDNVIDLKIEEDCHILANNIAFKQLMINIIKNAIEASKVGDPVTINVTKKNHFVEMQIIDYGSGMSESEIESLGTPFYSLKSNGTGLGLMICFHIIEKYHGLINFQSKKNVGTTVTIRFPASKS